MITLQKTLKMLILILTQVFLVAGKGFGDALKSSFATKQSNEGFHMSAAQVIFIERMESLRQKYATKINMKFDLSTYVMHEHSIEHKNQREKRSDRKSSRKANQKNLKTKSIRYRTFKKHHSYRS